MKKLLMTLVLLPLMAAAGGDYTWETQSNGDGTVTICGVIGAKPTGVLTIPATCDGKTVTKVGVRGYSHEDGSFANLDITGLVIPEGVTELFDGAFRGCTKLKSVSLPSTLKVIRNNCFEDCSALKSIVLPEGLQRVEFDFLNRTAVSMLNIPSTLVDIEEGSLAIPSGRKFTVAAGNPRYRIENDYVYDYANKIVFMRADYYQKTFVIPDGAVCIAECCFGDCDGGNITIPASVKRIDYGAFCECQGLMVTFLGEEPQVNKEDGGIFGGSTNVKVYVQPGQGWEDAVMRGTWQGCPIQYIGSPVTPSIESSYGPFVPGEKVSLTIPALIGYTAKKLPSGLKLNKKTGEITGAAKKPTGEAGVTVTFTKKNESTLTAQFVVADWPQIAFSCPGLASAPLAVGVTGNGEGIPLEMEHLSAVKSVKASKLPSGMKLAKDRKTGLWSITGAPKKAGDYAVTLTLTTTYGSKQVLTIPVHVAALPQWATGTFGGMIGRFIGPIENDDWRPYGMIEMKITTAGKITAKIAAGGKKYSFSANGFDSVDEDGNYHFRMTTKKGEVYEGEISATYHDVAKLVQVEDADDPEGSFTIAGREPYFAIVWRNEHGKDGRLSVDPTGRAQKVMDAVKAFKTVELAQFDPAYGSVVLKIDAKGKTKLSGKTADGVKISGASFLMLDDDCYHVIADTVIYDKKSGNVYDITPCWRPIFDAVGNVVDWDWKCCEHDLRIYPFE